MSKNGVGYPPASKNMEESRTCCKVVTVDINDFFLKDAMGQTTAEEDR